MSEKQVKSDQEPEAEAVVTAPVKVKLSPIEQTMLITLWSRAQDAATPNPVLGDTHAQDILDRVDTENVNPALLPKDPRYHNYITVRARQLDQWCRQFLEAHADQPVAVLHLACGLDLRACRLRQHCGVDVTWIDLDKPEVVNLRRRLVPDPAENGHGKNSKSKKWQYKLVGASVCDETWPGDIVPHDRPLLVVTEGLFPYLTKEQGKNLLKRLVNRAPAGCVVADTVGTILLRFDSFIPLYRGTGKNMLKWGVDDGDEVARSHPRLHLEETLLFRDLLPGLFASAAPPVLGILTPVFSLLPSWRTYGMLLRLEF